LDSWFSDVPLEELRRVGRSGLMNGRESIFSGLSLKTIVLETGIDDDLVVVDTTLNILDVEETHVLSSANSRSGLFGFIVTHSTTTTKKNIRTTATHKTVLSGISSCDRSARGNGKIEVLAGRHELIATTHIKTELIARIENIVALILNVKGVGHQRHFIRIGKEIVENERSGSVASRSSTLSSERRTIGSKIGILNELRSNANRPSTNKVASILNNRPVNWNIATRIEKPDINLGLGTHLIAEIDLLCGIVEVQESSVAIQVFILLEQELVHYCGIKEGEDVPDASTLLAVAGIGEMSEVVVFKEIVGVDLDSH